MITHRQRLYAIGILLIFDAAALIAAHYGLDADELRPIVESATIAVIGVLAPALADAVIVERRRRDPRVPAVSDDVRDVVEVEDA